MKYIVTKRTKDGIIIHVEMPDQSELENHLHGMWTWTNHELISVIAIPEN